MTTATPQPARLTDVTRWTPDITPQAAASSPPPCKRHRQTTFLCASTIGSFNPVPAGHLKKSLHTTRVCVNRGSEGGRVCLARQWLLWADLNEVSPQAASQLRQQTVAQLASLCSQDGSYTLPTVNHNPPESKRLRKNTNIHGNYTHHSSEARPRFCLCKLILNLI